MAGRLHLPNLAKAHCSSMIRISGASCDGEMQVDLTTRGSWTSGAFPDSHGNVQSVERERKGVRGIAVTHLHASPLQV
jgi:hypothetical protein